jgi:hypothetical protein
MTSSTQEHSITLVRNNRDHEIEVTLEVKKYIYGADADGNRGEERTEWEVTKATSPSLVLGLLELEEIDKIIDDESLVHEYDR